MKQTEWMWERGRVEDGEAWLKEEGMRVLSAAGL